MAGGRRRSRRTGEGARGCVVRTSASATDQGGRRENEGGRRENEGGRRENEGGRRENEGGRCENFPRCPLMNRERRSSGPAGHRGATSRRADLVASARTPSRAARCRRRGRRRPRRSCARLARRRRKSRSRVRPRLPLLPPARAIAPRPGATSFSAPLTAPLLRRRGRARREQGEDVRRAFQGVQGVSQGGARGNRPEAEGRTREALLKTRGGRGGRTTYTHDGGGGGVKTVLSRLFVT